MRAVIYNRYGDPDVLRVADVPEPTPDAGRVRVRVRAAALNPKDVLVRKGKMRWLVGRTLPRTPGYDIAGTLLDDAEGLAAGTDVFGMIGRHLAGGCAEQVALPPDEIARMPADLSMVEAAALPLAGLTALQALRDELRLEPGQRVLINGASGGVGTLAVQIARALGAVPVAVCSGRNADLVRDLGAASVIDYTAQSLDGLRGFDAVFDVFGSFPWARARRALRPGGRFCTTIPRAGAAVRGALRRLGLHRAALVVVKSRRSDLDRLRTWVESGDVRPVIDSTCPLDQSDAGHRRIESKRARGKVVIEVGD